MKTYIGIVAAVLLIIAGCPQPQSASSSAVTPLLGISSTSGPAAPFAVIVSATGSTSRNAGPLTYAWDFGDGTRSTLDADTHTFQKPGLYVVKLRVTDSAGETGTTSVDVRVKGSGAVAVIAADVDSGVAPLTVQFDGTHSDGKDDVIRDYAWDFGDGQQSTASKPQHTFTLEGQYTVTLRVVTAGGIEAHTQTTITAGTRNGSLQFDGGQFATLPLATGSALTSCTIEAWVKADTEGGNMFAVGLGEVSVDLIPTSNTIRLHSAGTDTSMSATSMAGRWRHLAVVYTAGSGGISGGETSIIDPNAGGGQTTTTGRCTLYLDGAAIGNAPASRAVTADSLTLGNGMRGKIGEVRFWSTARTPDQILASRNRRLTGSQANLLGVWPLDEGTGQVLSNLAQRGENGMLGSSASTEAADPAWSSDGPPL